MDYITVPLVLIIILECFTIYFQLRVYFSYWTPQHTLALYRHFRNKLSHQEGTLLEFTASAHRELSHRDLRRGLTLHTLAAVDEVTSRLQVDNIKTLHWVGPAFGNFLEAAEHTVAQTQSGCFFHVQKSESCENQNMNGQVFRFALLCFDDSGREWTVTVGSKWVPMDRPFSGIVDFYELLEELREGVVSYRHVRQTLAGFATSPSAKQVDGRLTTEAHDVPIEVDEDLCPACLGHFEEDEAFLKVVVCGHAFHFGCIGKTTE